MLFINSLKNQSKSTNVYQEFHFADDFEKNFTSVQLIDQVVTDTDFGSTANIYTPELHIS